MTRIRRTAANGIGVVVIAALAGFMAWSIAALYNRADAIWAWSIGFPILAICGLLLWHDKRWPANPQDALRYGLLSIPVGGISLMVDLGRLFNGSAASVSIRHLEGWITIWHRLDDLHLPGVHDGRIGRRRSRIPA